MARRIEQKVWFCRSFWIFLYVLELNSFLASQIFTKLQKIVKNFIFIFYLVNWTNVPRWIEQKVWFCRYFWIFLYVLELNSFLTSQILIKLLKIVNSFNIYILPCKLDLFATLNQTKSVILSIFLNFPRLNSFLALQIFTKIQKNC